MKHLFSSLPLFLFLLPCFLAAQTGNFQHQKDSLLNRVTSVEGSAKLEAYYDLTSFLYFREQNVDSVLKYLYLNEKEAEKQNNLKTQRNVRKNIGGLFRNRGLYDKFLDRAYDDLAFMEKHEFWDNYYDLTRKIVESYHYTGHNKKALDAATAFYEQAKRRNQSEGIQSTLYAIGFYYEANKREAEAEKYFRMSLDEANRSGKITDIKLTCYYQLVSSLINHRKWDECKEIFPQWEADTKKHEEDETRSSSSLYLNLYVMYLHYYAGMKDDVQAEKYCRLLEEKWPESRIAHLAATSNWASIYQTRKDWAKMLEYSEKAYKLHESYNSLLSMATLTQYKAKALNYLGQADECYAEIEHYATLRDSLANQELNAQLDELRTQYEVDKHIAEKEKVRNYMYFAFAGCVLLIFALSIWINYSQKVVKKNRGLFRQIKEQDILTDELEREREKNRKLLALVENEDITPSEKDEEDELFRRISVLMKTDKLFTNSQITRKTMGEKLNVGERYLHDCIRKNTDMGFSEYVTSLRLSYSRQLLAQPGSNLTIEAIAFDSGFNSRATFYRQFKEKYGLTPDEFRKLSSNF